MRGRYAHQIWQADPSIYAPPRYRRACEYEAFIPDSIAGLDLALPGEVAGVVSQGANPRADAAAWTLIAALPAHPVITVPVAVAATGRTKPAVANAIEQMEASGILMRLSDSARNRAWEAEGLLELIVGLEAGVFSAGGG